MKILHILNHIQEIGNGIVNVTIDLACLQAKSGHNVAIVSAGGEYEILLAQYGVKHFHLDQTRTPLNLINAAIKYKEIVQQFQPDIVHAHMMTGVVLARILKGKFEYALVSTVHNEFQRTAIFMGLADRVIAVSKAVAKSMMQRGILESKLQVVSNGTLGSPRSRPIEEYIPVQLQHPAIVTVSGMYQRKGIGELIDAFLEIALDFPQLHLYLVGDGPDRGLFEQKVKREILSDRIHFEGFQPQPIRYLLSADIFALASYRESFSLAIAEAREAGCAIVGTNVDGIPQTLDDGEAGILVPPKDSHALANVFRNLLTNVDVLESWKQKSRQNLEWLSAARVNQEILALYYELKPALSENSQGYLIA